MKPTYFTIILFILFSCSQPTQQEKDLKKAINSKLILDNFEYVQQQGASFAFSDFRKEFDYLSLIYLRDGCQPCYPTFIEWQQKMDSISSPDNHTLLFIIQGDSYGDFMSRALNYEYIEDRYYMILDPENKFSNDNNKIPYWILDSGILVDKENKIKMVGKPWVNDDMLKLFYKTIDYKE